MPPKPFDRERCEKRNRVAARRDGVEAVPVAFLRGAAKVGEGVTAALGTLPHDEAEALQRINAIRGEDAEPLTEEDVYVHYAEAANSAFIGDRYAFLSTRTLKNIVRDAQAGFAFMNSHRTGGLSHPSELPFGRTFCGRWERAEDGSERALIGFYMRRGVAPNGANGPTSDDLHKGIDAGTIFDVSVGLWGGDYVCDVCGGDLSDWESCPHVPGTTYDMDAEAQAAQAARGVTGGRASYTIDNARCGETSAVYDGAVPGAGFRKALSRQATLSRAERAQMRAAYSRLLNRKERAHMDATEIEDVIESRLERFGKRLEATLRGFGRRQHDESEEELPPVPLAPSPAVLAANGEQEKRLKSLEEQLAASQKREREAKLHQYKRDGLLLPAAEAHALKLMEADEDAFAAFLSAQGKLAVFAGQAGDSVDAATVAANLERQGTADNTTLHSLALARLKQAGQSANDFSAYSAALAAVAAENPDLVRANQEGLPNLS